MAPMALQVRIASPCSEKWESMQGDERTRHCARCKLNVFNVKELAEAEVRALLAREGKVCGRVYRRPDGTVLTRDCPTGLAAVRRKAMVAVAMAFTLAVTLLGYRAKGCPTPSSAGRGWFGRIVGQRVIEAREVLRETQTLGPLINELYPMEIMAGSMVLMPPSAP